MPQPVALTLSLNDRLVAPLQRALKEIEKGCAEINADLQAMNRSAAQADQTMATMRGPQQLARETREAARNVEQTARWAERLHRALNTSGQIVGQISKGMAGFQAAKFVLKEPLQQARSYERGLADLANVAYSDRDVKGRLAGVDELNKTVTAALRSGGGSREGAMEALNDMMASGKISLADAQAVLPAVMKYATAGNAAPKEIANIAVKALQNGFKQGDIVPMLDKALVAGQQGGFELKDMAKWLPMLMASGRQAGLTGMQGYERILASAQAAVITAGTRDEAGTNLRDLLSHVSSHALKTAGKRMGIDVTSSLGKALEGGTDTLTALVNLSDYVASQDPRFAAIDKKMKTATKPEQLDLMQKQAALFSGSAIGQLFHNQQSVLALVAERNNRGYVKDILKATAGATGQVGQVSFDTIASTADFKIKQKENEDLFALTQGVGGANGALAKLADATVDLYRKFPDLAQSIELTKLGLNTLTAGMAAVGGMGLLIGAKGLLGGGAAAAEAMGAGGGAAVGGAGAAGGMALAGTALGGGIVVGGGAASFFATGMAGTELGQQYGQNIGMGDDLSLASAILAAPQHKDEGAQKIVDAIERQAQRPIEVKVQVGERELHDAVVRQMDSYGRRN